jgi:hypothetical protein
VSRLPLERRPEGVCGARDPFQGIGLGQERPQRRRPSIGRLEVRRKGWHRVASFHRSVRVVIGPERRVVRLVAVHGRGPGLLRPVLDRGVEVRLAGARRDIDTVQFIGGLMAGSATDWISLTEAADILESANVHFRPSTIGAWARTGKLQSIKLGGRRFVRRGEVRALVTPPRRVHAADLQPRLFEEIRD